jgi:hypothetical protein
MRFEVLTAVKMSMLVFSVVPPALKMEALCASETLVYKFTRRYNPEYQHQQFSCDCEYTWHIYFGVISSLDGSELKIP